MRILYVIIIFIFSVVFNADAQLFSVSGKIYNKENLSLAGANVMLLNAADSSLLKATVTDSAGFFDFSKIAAGRYILKASFIGYREKFIHAEIINQSFAAGKIILNEKATTLTEAEVTGQVLPAQMKGDTTQYNADAYKTNKDASSEDLVTKMPGINMQDGKVQAQGEEVKKITVDGRPFFGDDPNAVLKNLPAEVIDKIQVFDKKSDQSQFTGFDDGNSTKTINIVTKPQFRNGTFGKIYGGYGTDDKWKGGFNLNFFKDKRRITLLANTNNINEQNFSSEDLLGVVGTSGSGNRGQGMRGGPGGRGRQGGQDNAANNFLVDQKNGINTTQSFGINYADKWGNLEFTGSYFFNYTENKAQSDLYRTYVTQQNAGYTYDEQSKVSSKNINHRANLKFEWKIDSLNSLLFQPRFSAQLNDGGSFIYGINRVTGSEVSKTLNNYNSDLKGINFTTPLLYRHSFYKKGRTFSVNATPGYIQNIGSSYLNSYTDYYSDTLSIDTLNQLSNLDLNGTVFSSNVTYTEPVTEKSQLIFTYTGNYNHNNSDKETYNYSSAEEKYTELDTVLTNKFVTNYLSNSIGTGFQYQQSGWNITVGIAYQNARLKSNQDFPYSADINKDFNSWLPNAMFMYKISAQKNLRIFYRSNNNAPTVTQLQNVINNSNPLQLTAGNPDLTQDWQNNLGIRYSSVNTAKSTSFFVFGGATYTVDYIANSVYYATADTLIAPEVILSAGSQLTRPVNLDTYVNARLFSTYSLPISKIKCNLNLNMGGSYTRTPGMITYEKNFANSTMASVGFTLSSNISDKIDFAISSTGSYNVIDNSLQTAVNSSYFNYNSKFRIQLMPYRGLVLQTDISHQFYNGLSEGYDQNYFLWNAGIGYKFMKDRVAEIRLTVYDILKQNQSITRNIAESYYEDVKSNVLEQYFMLTFTYNLKFFKGVSSR